MDPDALPPPSSSRWSSHWAPIALLTKEPEMSPVLPLVVVVLFDVVTMRELLVVAAIDHDYGEQEFSEKDNEEEWKHEERPRRSGQWESAMMRGEIYTSRRQMQVVVLVLVLEVVVADEVERAGVEMKASTDD
mmetsp:Transcript_9889/g.15848  ORF Transcript_9889/g.15848 Transcript_9889/m.15848 type:complete len:133 (-) Transcript_9889:311-709(-)